MLHWLHRVLTAYVGLRACDNGRLLALWKTLGSALGRSAYLNPKIWAWGPRVDRQGEAEAAAADMQEKLANRRRLRRYRMAGALLLQFGIMPYRVMETEIPRDAELAGAEWDQGSLQLTLFVTHASWPEVAEGQEIPLGKPTFYCCVPPLRERMSLN